MTSKSNLPRCSNYTIDEKLCLIRIVNKYSNKIENKQTDKVGLKEKNDTWKKVEKKWNEIAEYENKTANNLKFLWNNLKKIARKNFAKLKSETYKTGGGSCNVKLDIISEKVHEIIGRSITGIRYQHDSDNQTMEVLLQDHENDDPNIDCDDPVFEHMVTNGEIENWSSYTPNSLKKPISEPLHNAITSRSLLGPINGKTLKRKKRPQTTQERLSIRKIQLANLMMKHLSEKAALEREIMEAQLKKEQMQITKLQYELQGNFQPMPPQCSEENDHCKDDLS